MAEKCPRCGYLLPYCTCSRQPALFPGAGRRPATHQVQADRAIARAENGADKVWLVAALNVVRNLATEFGEFSSFDVLERLRTDHISTTRDLRALGAVIRKAVKRGWVVHSGRYVPHPKRHGAPVPVWTSRIYMPFPKNGPH